MISTSHLQETTTINVSSDMETEIIPIKHPRNIPHWLWVTIAKSLGIRLRENDRPILATIFSFLTYTSCIGFVISTFWFTVYDIISDYTKTTIIDGSVSIIYTILWGALGIYAHKLSRRLFSHPHFLKLVKLHSKTILKMNAAIILFLLMTLFIIINNINGYRGLKDSICETEVLKVVVCKIRYLLRVVFSVFALLWNYLAAFALTSVCRSHVIRLRKFMRVLQEDSANYEVFFLGLNPGSKTNVAKPLEEYSWVEENYLEELGDVEDSDLYHVQRPDSPSNPGDVAATNRDRYLLTSSSNPTPTAPEDTQSLEVQRRRNPDSSPILTNDEILFTYWKIQTDLRISSVALQRWMVSVITLVALWLAINLVLWISYDPNLVDMVNFLLPLLLLPLLSSAYAEVNQEGQRLLKFICLTESRVQLLYLLEARPLQMTVYSYTLSYKTIGTASFGVLLALASKILLQKMVM